MACLPWYFAGANEYEYGELTMVLFLGRPCGFRRGIEWVHATVRQVHMPVESSKGQPG